MIKRPWYPPLFRWLVFAVATALFWGCAHHPSLPDEAYQLAYQAPGPATTPQKKWAPVFIVYGHSRNDNRIGRPSVSEDGKGGEKVFIDTEDPEAYFLQRTFKTPKATYTNLIYRVHFPGIPYSLVPFNLSAGKNVGLMVVVTLNAENQPVLVTTVHTCGCYKAIVPTQYLPREDLPENWSGKELSIYGERLPPQLDFDGVSSPRILVYLRPDVHRVMDLEIRDERFLSDTRFRTVPMKIEPMSRLDHLPVDDTTTSFFHTHGLLKGHVKGAVKPFETLFLSLISMDLFVGTDKAYGDPARTGNPFYTSLKPWRRNDSDMWYFARFLWYWGWRL